MAERRFPTIKIPARGENRVRAARREGAACKRPSDHGEGAGRVLVRDEHTDLSRSL